MPCFDVFAERGLLLMMSVLERHGWRYEKYTYLYM